jgi:hypothetical protein
MVILIHYSTCRDKQHRKMMQYTVCIRNYNLTDNYWFYEVCCETVSRSWLAVCNCVVRSHSDQKYESIVDFYLSYSSFWMQKWLNDRSFIFEVSCLASVKFVERFERMSSTAAAVRQQMFAPNSQLHKDTNNNWKNKEIFINNLFYNKLRMRKEWIKQKLKQTKNKKGKLIKNEHILRLVLVKRGRSVHKKKSRANLFIFFFLFFLFIRDSQFR